MASFSNDKGTKLAGTSLTMHDMGLSTSSVQQTKMYNFSASKSSIERLRTFQ